MVVISPAVAPVLGAFMLPYTSWRGLFVVLGFIGIVSLAGGLLLTETVPSRYTGTMLQSVRRLGTVLKNPGFTSLLIVFSLVSLASLAFIADSSYIYEDGFGLSEQWFSFYFAINAVGMIAGPLLYLRLSRSFGRTSIITACFIFMIAGGALVCLVGGTGPLIFALALFPATLMGSCVRSPGAFLMLEQQKEDTGSASALINCFGLVLGSAGIVIASLDAGNLVLVLGMIYVATGLVCLTGWLLIGRFRLAKEVPDIAR
jgi:DHA1 family bicyclomycin/chloramphenicol resistance-like MFS transporter